MDDGNNIGIKVEGQKPRYEIEYNNEKIPVYGKFGDRKIRLDEKDDTYTEIYELQDRWTFSKDIEENRWYNINLRKKDHSYSYSNENESGEYSERDTLETCEEIIKSKVIMLEKMIEQINIQEEILRNKNQDKYDREIKKYYEKIREEKEEIERFIENRKNGIELTENKNKFQNFIERIKGLFSKKKALPKPKIIKIDTNDRREKFIEKLNKTSYEKNPILLNKKVKTNIKEYDEKE